MNYPKASQKEVRKLTHLLIKHSEQRNVSYVFQNEEIYIVEVFSYFGFLPLFCIEAKELYEQVYNRTFPTEQLLRGINPKIYEYPAQLIANEAAYLKNKPQKYKFPLEVSGAEDGTYLGLTVNFVKKEHSNIAIAAHFFIHLVEGYIKKYTPENRAKNDSIQIPIDPIYAKISEKISANKLSL